MRHATSSKQLLFGYAAEAWLFSCLIWVGLIPQTLATATQVEGAKISPTQNAPQIPAQVAIPVSHPIPVTLDTALSTLDSKSGQLVTFHLTYSILLGGGLEVPPNTKILGHVTEVKRSGHFDKQGVLQLAVDRIQLSGLTDSDAGTRLTAHLDLVPTKGQERSDISQTRSTAQGVKINPAESTMIGGATGGAVGAGIGAGAGLAAAALVLMSRRGQELYLVQGSHFTVTLDQPAYLGGNAVRTAQQNFKQNPGPYGIEADSVNDSMPKLKRRRAPQQ